MRWQLTIIRICLESSNNKHSWEQKGIYTTKSPPCWKYRQRMYHSDIVRIICTFLGHVVLWNDLVLGCGGRWRLHNAPCAKNLITYNGHKWQWFECIDILHQVVLTAASFGTPSYMWITGSSQIVYVRVVSCNSYVYQWGKNGEHATWASLDSWICVSLNIWTKFPFDFVVLISIKFDKIKAIFCFSFKILCE